MSTFDEFFKKALRDNLDFYKVVFELETSHNEVFLTSDWNSTRIFLQYSHGDEAGVLDDRTMPYWSPTKVSRKIPRGDRPNFTILRLE